MRNKLLVVLILAFALGQTIAADLFENGKLRQIKKDDLIVSTDTIGGYPIFQDDGRWKFVSGKESESTGRADPIKMGAVLLDYYQGTYLLARQWLNTNLGSGGGNYWTGSPCSPDHLVIRNKGQGRQDNCMTIDPKIVTVGTNPTLFLTIVLTNSGSSGRYYQMWLYVNADLLGIRKTGLGDWTQDELKANPYKQVALDRLTKWAELLQDGSIKAFDFSKPQDVYQKVPSLMTLLPVPDDLVGQKRAISFLSALEDLRNRPASASIAYSHWEDFKGSWGSSHSKASQEIADAEALEYCEKDRKAYRPNAPICTVYRMSNAKSNVKTIQQAPAAAISEKLEKLKALYTNGVITKEQYDNQVKDLLDKL